MQAKHQRKFAFLLMLGHLTLTPGSVQTPLHILYRFNCKPWNKLKFSASLMLTHKNCVKVKRVGLYENSIDTPNTDSLAPPMSKLNHFHLFPFTACSWFAYKWGYMGPYRHTYIHSQNHLGFNFSSGKLCDLDILCYLFRILFLPLSLP